MMIAKSIQGKSVEQIRAALDSSLADGFKPTLAVAFVSISMDLEEISNTLSAYQISVFGASTSGEFIDENLEKNSAAILLMDMPEDAFSIGFAEFEGYSYHDIASDIARDAKALFGNPAFLIACSDVNTDGEAILKGFSSVLGMDANVVGGMAGDDFTISEQFVFTNGLISNKAIVSLALDQSRYSICGRATCGWKAVGTEKTVTRSEGNHVYTVDNVPVLDLTVRYGGLENINPGNEDLHLEIAANLPLQLQRESGDPIMRPGLVVDWNDGSFYCSGSVPQGSKVRFSIPPDFDVMNTVIRAAEDMKEKEIPEADAVVIFSCAGRILAFGPMMNTEIEGIKKVWNAPMVGMFSLGEMARATGGKLELHNLTTCIVAIKELEWTKS